ncbi:SEC-C metal-binding domain-containing protein [Niallia endozanthoxylica]|uniref:SEC-C motif-containing protein n=1 Tax=Niallia endozanthoxylica TaxID=2036016 RepID=A0A5J5H4L7_9BACI|nr:SEC-C metal-binding domain-containing protein [Niallia endozanthoxylica]KAA9015526.1 hypothetical protein F4V44_23000 [Niallia endozanthoxylica]
MEVGRNDLCPCGSGKKYKKCCMKKAQVVEIGQVKRERFFQLKYQLVQSLVHDVFPSFSLKELNSLEKEFEKRVEVNIPDSFFQHWILFFRRDEQGMRAIERYNHTNGNHRDPMLRELALEWEKMIPRLIQQVDYDDQGIFVEDLFTKERFHMPYCETMPKWIPWAGTLCMLEEFDGGHYINGVATSVAPDSVKNAYYIIAKKMKENNCSMSETAFEFYPEIIKALLEDVNPRKKQKEIYRTEFHYDVQNVEPVFQVLQKDERFYMDEWKGNNGQGAFLQNIYRYEDNCSPGPVRIAEAVANLEIKGKKLVYATLSSEEAASFKKSMSGTSGVQLVDEKVDKMMAPPDAKVTLYSVMMPQEVPQEFAAFAQMAVIVEETDQPLPMFDGLSPEQMAAEGKMDELEQWLRQQEYSTYVNMNKENGQVKVTADFNTVRKKLGLELSPFVTLRAERKSRLIPEVLVDAPAPEGQAAMNSSVTKEDFDLMEEIGIPFEEAEQFYVKDILDCFKEKGAGKSQSTYYKYRLGLQTIGYFLSQKLIYSWSDVNEDDWRKWLTFNYLAFNMDATVNQVKGFMSVLKNFTDKIDADYGTNHASFVKKLIKELEPSILTAVKVMDSYAGYQVRRYEPEFDMDPLFDTIESGPVIAKDDIKGLFKVIEVKEEGVTVELIGLGNQVYFVSVDSKHLEYIELGMVIFGELEKTTSWHLSKMYRTFPTQSVQYIGTLVAH